MEPGNYGFFENFCEEEEELHDNSFTRNMEKDKLNNQNQIQGQNQNYNNSIQNMQSNQGVHNIQQNQLIKNIDQNIQNQGINQNISMNQKKSQEIEQLDINSKQFQVRGEQLKDNIPLMRSVWIYNEEPLPNKKNLNRIFEKNKVLGGLQGFIGCSNDQENDIQQNQQQQQQNQQKIYQQNDFDQIDCESLFQNNYESENFQIQQLFRQETYFKHQREQELGKQIQQQQQQENKENLHKNLRRKDRKNSNSHLPSFVEKISENLEDTIEGIDVSQYSEFSKGEQVLLKQVENFLFIEEKKENQGADYYFEKYFIKNYSRLLEKLKQYSQQSRLTGNQFLKFAFAFGTVLVEELINFIKKCDSEFCFNQIKKQELQKKSADITQFQQQQMTSIFNNNNNQLNQNIGQNQQNKFQFEPGNNSINNQQKDDYSKNNLFQQKKQDQGQNQEQNFIKLTNKQEIINKSVNINVNQNQNQIFQSKVSEFYQEESNHTSSFNSQQITQEVTTQTQTQIQSNQNQNQSVIINQSNQKNQSYNQFIKNEDVTISQQLKQQKQVQKQIDEESSSSQIDLSQIYQLPKFEKSNNCSNKSRKTFTNQETQILKFYMQKYNTIPNTIIEQFAKQTGRTSSAVMQKIIRLKKNVEKSKDQNMSQNNNQQQFNSNQQLQCELEFNDGQIQNLNKNNLNQNEGNNSNNQINSSGNLIQNNNQQQQKQMQENINNNNFENNLVNKIKDQNQQSLEIQLVRVLYNMGNQQGTKQDILNELEVLNNEKKINLPENWNKSASQLLASSKYFEKIKGVFSLSYDPDKGQRLSVSDLQSQKSKLQYIFENYSGNNLDLGQILNFYLDMFCQQQMMEDVSQNFEKKLKLSIQKNLNQYDCFDKSKSKTMYTLTDRIKQELKQCDYMGFYTQGQQQQWQTQQQQQQKQIIKIENTQNQQKDLNQKQNQQYQYESSYDNTNQQLEESKIQKLEFQNSFFGNNLDIQMGSKMGSLDFQGQNFKEKSSDNQNIQCNQNNNIFRNYHENNYVDSNNTNEKIEQEDDQQQQHFQFLMENDNNQHSQHQVNNFDNNMNNNDQSLDLEEDTQQQINSHSN